MTFLLVLAEENLMGAVVCQLVCVDDVVYSIPTGHIWHLVFCLRWHAGPTSHRGDKIFPVNRDFFEKYISRVFLKKSGHMPHLSGRVTDSGPMHLVSTYSVHKRDKHHIYTLMSSFCTTSMYTITSSIKVIFTPSCSITSVIDSSKNKKLMSSASVILRVWPWSF